MKAKGKIAGTKPGAKHVVGPGGLDAAGFARWYREQALAQWEGLDLAAVSRLASEVAARRGSGRTVWVMGNGGSAATASHFATDFSKTASVAGRPQLRCVCLNDNAAYMTAIANDLSFDQVFSRQLENLVCAGDLVLLISGSGNSPNLLEAARLARGRKATVAALLGFDGGALKGEADVVVHVPSDQYGVIEDLHMAIGHVVTFFLKQSP